MRSSQQPNVTICSPFRDAESYLWEYIRRINGLDYPIDNLRVIAVEGDSNDDTQKHLITFRETSPKGMVMLIKCDTGKPKHGSVVNAERFATLAQVFNAALDAVDLEWTDYVLFLPSDIRYEPDLLKRLLAVDEDIVSPFVWIYINDREFFYDCWAFRRNGSSLGSFPRDQLAQFGNEPIRMDTVGGVTLINTTVLKAGVRYTPDEVDRGFCKWAKREGFHVLADPTTHVYHPPFAPEPDQGLTEIYSRDVEKVKAGIWEKYRFVPPDAYVKDLIAFMSEFTHDRE